MNYKLYALLLTLILATSPALQAMRARGAFLATTRSLRYPTSLAGRQTLARTYSTNNKKCEHLQGVTYNTPANNGIPAEINTDPDLTFQEQASLSNDKFDAYHVNSIIESLEQGVEKTKTLVTQAVTQNISKYDGFDIGRILKASTVPNQTIITIAIANNINQYSGYDLSRILMAANVENKEIITTAIAKNIDNNIHEYYANPLKEILEASRGQNKEIIIKAIISKIDTGCSGSDLVEILQIADEKNKQNIIKAIAHNITKYRGYNLKEILVALNVQDKKIITQAIVNNIDSYYGVDLKEIFVASNVQDKKIITQAIVNNIDNYCGVDLKGILEVSDTSTREIITIAITNVINHDINKYSGCDYEEILKASDEQGKEIIAKAIINNIDKYNGRATHDKFEKILKSFNAQQQKLITKAIAQNINNTIDNYSVEALCSIISASNEQSQNSITRAIVANLDKFSGYGLQQIRQVSNIQNEGIISRAILNVIYDLIGQCEVDSQSTVHLKYSSSAIWHYIITIANNPKHKAVFQQALSHEYSISDDSAVFYHSQKSPVYWLELLYTKLWDQKYNQKSTNYLFTRFPEDQSASFNATLQLDGQQKRASLLKGGRIDELRPYLLFANYAIFGNATNCGSSSAGYFINNHNVGNPSITTQTIIDKFGDQTIFDKYKVEFEQLENEFKEIIPNSVLLQFKIPHTVLSDHVYLAAPGGIKKKLQIDNEETDNITTIIKTLKTKPMAINNIDEQEFCIIMTPDTVHTLREQGAEIRAYGDFDQAKLDALILKLEALIARIAQENPQTFSAKLMAIHSNQACKPVLDASIKTKD